jgi:hypothetical protein
MKIRPFHRGLFHQLPRWQNASQAPAPPEQITTQKTAAAKKSEHDPEEEEQLSKLVNVALMHWAPENNDNVKLCEEQDVKNLAINIECCQVAKWMVLFEGRLVKSRSMWLTSTVQTFACLWCQGRWKFARAAEPR